MCVYFFNLERIHVYIPLQAWNAGQAFQIEKSLIDVKYLKYKNNSKIIMYHCI